jgi:hypothetical protein
MALDVYVGSLTRYYVGDWESVGERTARERAASHPMEQLRSRGTPLKEVGQIKPEVLAWRTTLGNSLGDNVAAPLDWDESSDAPHFTGRPGWDGFGSLVLWAAYAEHPALRRPPSLPEEWDDDPALVRSNADGFRSRYAHLVRNVELWLPCAFQFTFEGQDVDGRRIVIGSATTLVRQLADLNAATWKADDSQAASWRRAPLSDDAPLELRARYAFAVLVDLAQKAVDKRLPMKLDY